MEKNNNLPFVSVIIPCRNEERLISKCLESIINNDYPKNKLEVLIVDGISEDRTRIILENYTKKYSYIRFLDNPKKITPIALNIGIKEANGDIIVEIDAHATHAKDYISKCAEYLNKYNVDNVGGTMVTLPRNNTLLGKAIVAAISCPFGVGKSFRVGLKNLQLVETVFGGCYRKEIFKKIGLFNENLKRGHDWEFNTRLKKAGGKILFVPEIVSYYYARSTLGWSFLKYYFVEGFWAIYPAKFVGRRFISFWRLAPLFFVLSLIGSLVLAVFYHLFFWLLLTILGVYFLSGFYFGVKIVLNKKDWRYVFIIPWIFFVIHVFYGLGSFFATIKILMKK